MRDVPSLDRALELLKSRDLPPCDGDRVLEAQLLREARHPRRRSPALKIGLLALAIFLAGTAVGAVVMRYRVRLRSADGREIEGVLRPVPDGRAQLTLPDGREMILQPEPPPRKP